jgi:hypothetical protein
MQNLFRLGVCDAELPPHDRRHSSDRVVVERVAESVSADHSGRAHDSKTCLARRRSVHNGAPLLPRHTVRSVSNSSRQAVLNSRIRLTELLLIISRSSTKLLFGSE